MEVLDAVVTSTALLRPARRATNKPSRNAAREAHDDGH